jgi:hypothetical protein
MFLVISFFGGRGDRMVLDIQLPMQSVPITNIVVSSNPDHFDVYSIHHYVTKKSNLMTYTNHFYNIKSFNQTPLK